MALSAAQIKARARFTKAAKKAKQLRKANPKLSQAEAIKKAFALDKKPAAKKKAAKKVAGLVSVKRKGKKTSVNYTRIAGVKKTAAKHTDQKSHNVNIRVMSGISPTKFYM